MVAPAKNRRTFARETSGNFTIIAALFLPIAVLCAAIVIDLSMLSLEKRRAQTAVDIAAIVAAQNIHTAEIAARKVLSLNGEDTITNTELGRLPPKVREKAQARPRVTVTRGHYEPEADKKAEDRFVANVEPFNAARVTLRKDGRYFFAANTLRPPEISVSAIASAQQLAAFSVGSRLLALRDGVANELLGALVGADVNLSVLDYNALLDADVDAFGFLDALALELDIVSGRYSNVLASEPSLGDVVNALAQVSNKEGEGAAAQALDRIYQGAVAGARKVELSGVIDLGPLAGLAIGEAGVQGMPAKVKVMDLLFANAVAANGETLLDLDLAASVPGLSSVIATVSVGERLQESPWLRVGVDNEIVTNAQIRLKIVATLLGNGALKAVTVRIPLYFEIARAEGRLGEIRCPGGLTDAAEVDILARPGVVDLWLGEADLSKKITHASPVARAQIVSTPALTVKGRARAKIDNLDEIVLKFTYDDIVRGEFKRTSTKDILASLLSSLGRDVELDIEVGGLQLGAGPLLKPLLNSAIADALSALDEPIAALLETLGVSIGEADVRVNGVRCDRSVLVQ